MQIYAVRISGYSAGDDCVDPLSGVGARCTPITGVDLNDRLGYSSEDRCEGELTIGYDPQTEEEDQAAGILAAEEGGLAA
eukprot:8905106-Pyramimonas_sp.AAC.1